mmetsp:Transcript_35025/g.57219  ORF Transcript_35025/g.57219 Transcript_35025/m.57219 type:complete len:543 (-) Transcript_35025:77-1705(-)
MAAPKQDDLFDISEVAPDNDDHVTKGGPISSHHATNNGESAVGETMYDDDMFELEGKENSAIDEISNAVPATYDYVDDEAILVDINHLHHAAPGASAVTAKPPTPETTLNDASRSWATDDEVDPYDADEIYIESIHTAMSMLQSEISVSEEDRRQNTIKIEQQFAGIIRRIAAKKACLLQQMNSFYNDQRVNSMNRIIELKDELSEKQRALTEKKKRKQQQQQQEQEEAQRRKLQLLQEEQERKEQAMMATSGFTSFGNLLKQSASKARDSMGSVVKAIGQIASSTEQQSVAITAEYAKHDKLRICIPNKALTQLIESDIRLSMEWWDTTKLNHIVYECQDDELWRASSMKGVGWYNAFGTQRVRKGQRKRWNVRIGERSKVVELKNGAKPPADIALGVIAVDSLQQAVNKEGGFWLSKCGQGFALYGWNGKIFHGQQNGTMYGKPIHAGSVVGIELDLRVTPGMEREPKRSISGLFGSKSKVNSKAYSQTANAEIGKHGGVIKFYIDDEDLGVAFYDIEMDKQYAFAVAMKSGSYSLQLIE